MKKFLRRFGKSIAAVAFAGLTVAYTGLTDQHIDPVEGVAIATASTQAVLTWVVPLTPSQPWLKTVVNGLLAVLGSLAVVIVGGLDAQEISLLVLAAMSVVGVGALPAASTAQTGGPGGARTTEVGWFAALPQNYSGAAR